MEGKDALQVWKIKDDESDFKIIYDADDYDNIVLILHGIVRGQSLSAEVPVAGLPPRMLLYEAVVEAMLAQN